MTAPAPMPMTLDDLVPGQRFGLRGLAGWLPVEFEERRALPSGAELLLFRVPANRPHPSGFVAAFCPDDLVLGDNLVPAETVAFETVCPDCQHAAHTSETWLSCARCLGTHLIPLEPWGKT
jgi:hypothetical protein